MNRSHLVFGASLIGFLSAFARDGAAQPTVQLNGNPNPAQTDNTAVVHLKKTAALSIELRGTPGNRFALLLAGDALDGSQSGEPSVTSGFFLKAWATPGLLDVPIHPVFDGIGGANIVSLLNGSGQASLASDDLLPTLGAPLFRFDANGRFDVLGSVPEIANLVNLAPSALAPNPLPLSLESSTTTQFGLYLQLIELDRITQQITVGTGLRIVFDPITYGATMAYAEGTSGAAPSTAAANQVTQTVFPSTINDADFADSSHTTPTLATDFSFATQGIDFWAVGLAGRFAFYNASNPANGFNGTGVPIDQDTAAAFVGNALGLVGMWNQASGLEIWARSTAVRNNENREFPRIDLPGEKSFFHYRDIASGRFGFGILFEETNTWRNLTPFPAFTFVGPSVLSAFECEVAVTPDGTRAIVVLDEPAPATTDRVFVLNLEPGGLFGNGLPIIECVPAGADAVNFRKVYEESIEFVSDGAGSYVAYFGTTSVATPVAATYPNCLYRVSLANPASAPSLVLPGGAFPAISRLDRQFAAAADRSKLFVTAGTSAAAENVFVVSNVTPTTEAIVNATGNLLSAFQIGEFNEASDGQLGVFAVSPDGSRFAFAREEGTLRLPRCANSDGSSAGLTVDLVTDINQGGQFDRIDFGWGRDYTFTADSRFLILQQGFFVAGALSDRFDQFVVDTVTGIARNLTRTCNTGPTATPATLFGPWDPQGDLTTHRANVEPSGSFVSRSGDYYYFLRELRGLPSVGFDRVNLVAVSIATPSGASEPSFEMFNVTGTEFEPFEGAPAPSTGTSDTTLGATLFSDVMADSMKLRRLGGDGALADFYAFVSQTANLPTNDPRANIDQLYLFDAENPGPALRLTDFHVGGSGTLGVRGGARIVEVVPNAASGEVLYVVDNGDSVGAIDNLQDVFLADLSALSAPARIPAAVPAYSRVVARGSTKFYPGDFGGVFFSAGATPRSVGATLDGFAQPTADFGNALDSTAYFVRTLSPSVVQPIVPQTTASRSANVISVRATP